MFPFQQYLNLSKQFRNRRETRLKVQAFAKFYHYRPNIALSLRIEKQKQWNHYTEIVHYFFYRYQWNRTGCQ
jgi:LacI family transcriptional regulator